MNTPVIEVRNFCKRFTLHQQGGVVINALDNVSFSVSAGECLALSGPSGAGKSTMLKALYGNYLPSSGEILVRTDAGTIDIGKASPRTVMKLRLGVISFVTQFLRVIPRVTALSLVAEPLAEAGVDPEEARSRARDMLYRLNLPERLWNLAPATFSGGEQQRVAIARALINSPEILLADEPTGNLDVHNSMEIMELLEEINRRGTTVLVVTHSREIVAEMGKRVITLTRGVLTGDQKGGIWHEN